MRPNPGMMPRSGCDEYPRKNWVSAHVKQVNSSINLDEPREHGNKPALQITAKYECRESRPCARIIIRSTTQRQTAPSSSLNVRGKKAMWPISSTGSSGFSAQQCVWVAELPDFDYLRYLKILKQSFQDPNYQTRGNIKVFSQ